MSSLQRISGICLFSPGSALQKTRRRDLIVLLACAFSQVPAELLQCAGHLPLTAGSPCRVAIETLRSRVSPPNRRQVWRTAASAPHKTPRNLRPHTSNCLTQVPYSAAESQVEHQVAHKQLRSSLRSEFALHFACRYSLSHLQNQSNSDGDTWHKAEGLGSPKLKLAGKLECTTDGATHAICHITKHSLGKRWVALRHFHNFVDGTCHFQLILASRVIDLGGVSSIYFVYKAACSTSGSPSQKMRVSGVTMQYCA